MPITKYECGDCGKEFAKIFFEASEAPDKCPVCGAANIRELGEAFTYDAGMLNRVIGADCGSCGGGDDDGCGCQSCGTSS